MDSYTSLKEKHALTGIYSLNENSGVCAELAAYASALDEVCDLLDEIYRECFISTAETYGLSHREKIIFKTTSQQLPVNQRRNILEERFSATSDDFNIAALEKLLSTFGAQFSITENPREQRIIIDAELSGFSQETINLFVNSILDFVPAHLETEVVYSGKRWRDLDSAALSFAQIDEKNYSWAQIDALV